MKDQHGYKYLPAARVIELLSKLPPDSHVMANELGNIIVTTEDGLYQLAIIDFYGDGELVMM